MFDYVQITKVFTKTTINNLIEGKEDNNFRQVIENFVPQHKLLTYETIFDILYGILNSQYRNEYYYKNTMLNKWLFGKYSPNTTSMITELPVDNSKADFVVVNKEINVYEIKTELDNYDRLDGQLRDYYKVFPYVNVITSDNNRESICNKLGDSVEGIYLLTKKNTISCIKKPTEYREELSSKSIFYTLRKKEYEDIIQKYYGGLPECNMFDYYDICKELVTKLDVITLYGDYRRILLNRKHISEEIYSIPLSLRFLCYNMELSDSNYRKLNRKLKLIYQGGE